MSKPYLNPDDRILVTGGAGYVGSHLVRILLDRGYKVRVLDNFLYGPAGLRSVYGHPALEVVYGDICNVRDMLRASRDVRAVIALAALVGDGACEIDHDETMAINIESTKVLANIVRHFPAIERVVFASSCSVYGATEGLILNEGSRLNPVSYYARSRIVSEEMLRRELSGRSLVLLRLGTVFGASDRPRFDLMVNTMTCRALSEGKVMVMGGDAWRPHVHCADVAAAFAAACEASADLVSGETFNVGADENNYTIRDVARMVAEAIPGTEIEEVDHVDDLRSYRVSFDKIRHVLGFVPSRSIAEGIEEVRELVQHKKLDPKEPRYSNLAWLKSRGFGGEGRECLAALESELGKVA
jgi:nucleoside-diphosphate-sugar epimerase